MEVLLGLAHIPAKWTPVRQQGYAPLLKSKSFQHLAAASRALLDARPLSRRSHVWSPFQADPARADDGGAEARRAGADRRAARRPARAVPGAAARSGAGRSRARARRSGAIRKLGAGAAARACDSGGGAVL